MTRLDLVRKINAQFSDLGKKKVEQCVSIMFKKISDTLCNGNRIELRGFGVFEVRRRNQRNGRNPKTGQKVFIPEKSVPFFKAGKLMREQLNQRAPLD